MPGLRLYIVLFVGMLCARGAAADEIVAEFGNGAGARAVGIIGASEEVEASGPTAISTSDDGTIYILDQNNSRVLAINGQRAQAAPDILPLPEGAAADDLAVVRNQIFVWSDGVMALDKATGAGDPPRLRSAGGEADEFVRSAFASMGISPPGPISGIFEEVGRSAGAQFDKTPVTQYVASRGLGDVVAQLQPRSDRQIDVQLRRASAEESFMALALDAEDRLGSFELLDIDTSGRAFALVELVTHDGTAAAMVVARFAPDGALDRLYDLPIDDESVFSRRFVTIGPRGDVLFLRSEVSRSQVLRLAGRATRGTIGVPKTATLKDRPQSSKKGSIAVSPKTRIEVVERAIGFETVTWRVTASAYGAGVNCSGMRRIRRPAYIIGKLNQTVTGIPYCWGCKTPLERFQSELAKGRPAGNVCTRSAPQASMIGVDCSAFVSETWGLKNHVTTRDIPYITRRVSNPWGMKPGDAFNKPGSHVMLFLRYTKDRKVEVMEASPNACKGRVCRNIYSLSSLLMRGYRPVSFKGFGS